nr:MAG TPA: hypothetical protein [Caudoviricetes sp.]
MAETHALAGADDAGGARHVIPTPFAAIAQNPRQSNKQSTH